MNTFLVSLEALFSAKGVPTLSTYEFSQIQVNYVYVTVERVFVKVCFSTLLANMIFHFQVDNLVVSLDFTDCCKCSFTFPTFVVLGLDMDASYMYMQGVIG